LGRLLYEFALRDGVEDVLELGFAHGTSTAYIAAALDEKRSGCVTTLDKTGVLERVPNVHAVLEHLGLESWVRPIVAADSYNWELMKIIDQQTSDTLTKPCFDFCFMDGAHTWETDGFAFLLVDRLLRPDRWLVFDDIAWSFAASPSLRGSQHVREMAEEQRSAKQVGKVVDLLVRPAGYEVRLLCNVALAFKGDPDGNDAHRHDFEGLVELGETFIRDLAWPAKLPPIASPGETDGTP